MQTVVAAGGGEGWLLDVQSSQDISLYQPVEGMELVPVQLALSQLISSDLTLKFTLTPPCKTFQHHAAAFDRSGISNPIFIKM